jgi:serine/threonine protein phosphatase 1
MSRLFAISDIHGCYKTFYDLVVNRINLTRADKLVLLGDYIDRGPSSKEVIDFIIDLRKNDFNVVPLAGNHEQMLVDAIRDPHVLPLWLMNSGTTTLESLHITAVTDIDPKYIDFFTGLSYFETEGDNIFVHAGFNDNASDPFSDFVEMIWRCRTEYSNPLFSGKRIIHGHRPKTIDHVKKMISGLSQVIPIDTGCVYDEEDGLGYLSAIEIRSMELISTKRVDDTNLNSMY